MKKYTVIYSERVGNFSMHVYKTCFKHIETDNLKQALEEFGGNVWFVFDGWCEITKD